MKHFRFSQKVFICFVAIIFCLLVCNVFFAQQNKKGAQNRSGASPGGNKSLPPPAISGTKPELVVQNGHADNIRAVAFSADGMYLASGSADKTVRLWESESGKLIRTFEGHYDDVTSVAFSPNANILASGSLDKTVKLWDVNTGKLLRSMKGNNDAVNALAFSSDGRLIASGSKDALITIWDANKGQEFATIQAQAGVRSVAFSPDSRTIAAGCENNSVQLFDTQSGNLIKTLEGHSAGIRAVAFSPDGKRLASASLDKTVKVWELTSSNPLYTLTGHTSGVVSAVFSKDGKFLASGSQDRTVKVWDAASGRLVRTIEGQTYPISSIAFKNDADTIAAASYKTIVLVSATTGSLIRSLESRSFEVRAVALSGDGKVTAISNARSIKLWDTVNGRLIRTLDGHTSEVSSLAFSPDSRTLASGSWDKTVKLWDVESGKVIRTLSGHTAEVRALAFSPDGKSIASGGEDRTIKLWNVASGKLIRTLEGHHSLVSSVAFSPDSQTLVSGSVDMDVRLWDVNTGKTIRTLSGHESQVHSVAFSPDGKTVVSGSGDQTYKLWNVASGTLIRSVEANSFDVLAVAFSPDGKIIATGGYDKTIKLWDAKTSDFIRSLEGHSAPISSIAFSSDSRALISGSWDTTAKVWWVDSGGLATTFLSFKDGNWIAFTPDGYYDGSDKSGLYISWRVGNKVYDFDQLFDRFYKPAMIPQVLQHQEVKPAYTIAQGFALPPEVKIVSPRMNDNFDNPDVEIKVETKDTGGGVNEIRLYQNGKLVDPNSSRIAVIVRNKQTSFHVLLTEGDNYIKVVALSKDKTESKPAELNVKLTAPKQDVTLHLLAVGLNKYKNSALNLRFSRNDAEGVAAFFQSKGKSLFKEVKTIALYDEEATRANILKAFQTLSETAKPQDVVIIYFAGHGDSVADKWYFIPYDIVQPEKEDVLTAQGISSANLSDMLIKLRSQKILVLLDSCKSGTAITAFRGYEDRKAFAQLARSSGVHIIAASTPDQLAAEVKDLGHGVFTYLLLKGLDGEATVGQSNKIVTVRGLLSYVEEQMPEISKKYKTEAQYPVSSSKGMDFPVALLQ